MVPGTRYLYLSDTGSQDPFNLANSLSQRLLFHFEHMFMWLFLQENSSSTSSHSSVISSTETALSSCKSMVKHVQCFYPITI